jgi:hypothetical protein
LHSFNSADLMGASFRIADTTYLRGADSSSTLALYAFVRQTCKAISDLPIRAKELRSDFRTPVEGQPTISDLEFSRCKIVWHSRRGRLVESAKIPIPGLHSGLVFHCDQPVLGGPHRRYHTSYCQLDHFAQSRRAGPRPQRNDRDRRRSLRSPTGRALSGDHAWHIAALAPWRRMLHRLRDSKTVRHSLRFPEYSMGNEGRSEVSHRLTMRDDCTSVGTASKIRYL